MLKEETEITSGGKLYKSFWSKALDMNKREVIKLSTNDVERIIIRKQNNGYARHMNYVAEIFLRYAELNAIL